MLNIFLCLNILFHYFVNNNCFFFLKYLANERVTLIISLGRNDNNLIFFIHDIQANNLQVICNDRICRVTLTIHMLLIMLIIIIDIQCPSFDEDQISHRFMDI